ncbi:hypothetical protein SAMN05421503_1563 [Terribacillus aidingensis]|uniref:Asp/Glu/Hydantoin racemase n=1 Tax=Terribacillus aidingensis TaxID=586416 RepID=A0A285NKY3_9BACI|nr:hypothetical protein [Terribacillus aidingensis]SNZ10152.1 hypothetical protein SAMN05421503_1563 [Terribacillus aidingensis]
MNIACLHAHHSNIDYIEKALASYDVALTHYVDPALMYHIKGYQSFNPYRKVEEQINWISSTNPDAILLTCTNYILYLSTDINLDIPIIKIDEPFFLELKQYKTAKLYFTNPDTVQGTMNRLHLFVNNKSSSKKYSVEIIPNAFQLIMANKKNDYTEAIVEHVLAAEASEIIAFSQLSMVDAALPIEAKSDVKVITSINALTVYLERELRLTLK